MSSRLCEICVRGVCPGNMGVAGVCLTEFHCSCWMMVGVVSSRVTSKVSDRTDGSGCVPVGCEGGEVERDTGIVGRVS